METYIYIFFAIIGLFAIVSVVIGLRRIIGNPKDRQSDGETDRLCKTLDGEELFKLASSLVDEEGCKSDYDKWMKYTLAAANKGNVSAQRELGKYYKYDNNELAIDWLKQAADGGDSEAASELGEIYQYGLDRGIPEIEKDIDKAVEVFKTFADNGDIAAQKKLACCYRYYKDDDAAALEWYLKAADAGDAEAMLEASNIYFFNGEDDKAVEIMLKAARTGYAEAECAAGNYYSDQEDGDFAGALEWYKKAAEHGDTFAMCRLGEMSLAGEGVLVDKNKAVEWFQKAMDGGSIYGEFLLGRCYMEGDGVPQDIEKGIEHYREAAKYDNDAQYALAECYLSGTGVKKDAKKAAELLTKALDGMDPRAAYRLGELYRKGEGVKKDDEKAKELWFKAAKDGNEDAAESLKIYYGETVED